MKLEKMAMTIEDNFIIKDNSLICQKCRKHLPLPMPMLVDHVLAMSYGFRAGHMATCFDDHKPLTEIGKIMALEDEPEVQMSNPCQHDTITDGGRCNACGYVFGIKK